MKDQEQNNLSRRDKALEPSSADPARDSSDPSDAFAAAVATLNAISASQAIIEFEMDGTIITANDNYLTTMGYQLSEIVGKHHNMFVTPDYKKVPTTYSSGTN